MLGRFITFLPVFLLVVIADQLSKWYFLERFFVTENPLGFFDWLTRFAQDRRGFAVQEIHEYLNMVVVWNPGISFGFLANNGDNHMNVIILSAVAIVISLFFFVLLFKKQNRTQHMAIAFIIAGALANVWDRVRFGAVYDFIDFHIGDWHYPAFNIADSAIVVGVLIYVIVDLCSRDKEQNPLAKKVGRWHDD